MDGGNGDVVRVVHLVGIRAERDLVEEIAERRTLVHAAKFVDGIDKFVDIRFFVDALVRVVGVHAQYAAVVDDVAHDLVGARLHSLQHEAFEECAERLHLLLAARVERQIVHI